MMSVQYTRGRAVHWGMFSTSRGILSIMGENIMSTMEGFQYNWRYHEYTKGIMVNAGEGHWENN